MGMQKSIDFRVYYDIVKYINNHEEWHERSGSMTAQQPVPKGANASPIHEVKDGKRNHWTSPLCEVFCFKVKVTPLRPILGILICIKWG